VAKINIRFVVGEKRASELHNSDRFHSGARYYGWYPNCEENAILIPLNVENVELKVWHKEDFYYRPIGESEEEATKLAGIRKRDKERSNGYLYPGPLIGKLSFSQVPESLTSAIEEEQFNDDKLVSFCKKIAHFVYEGAGRYINVLRYQYGQHWLIPVEKYQEGDGLSNYFYDYDIRWHNPKDNLYYIISPKLGERVINIIFLGDCNNPEKQAVEKNDLQNLISACQQHYKPSIAAQLLLNAHELADKGEWRLALVETATALEAAVNQFLTGAIEPEFRKEVSLSSRKSGIDRNTITIIAATLAGATKESIESARELIKIRNAYIHDGIIIDDEKLPSCVNRSIKLINTLLATEVKKLCHYYAVQVQRGTSYTNPP
jgi:hypothetical protein